MFVIREGSAGNFRAQLATAEGALDEVAESVQIPRPIPAAGTPKCALHRCTAAPLRGLGRGRWDVV
jgi:hypothetical protein